MSQPTSGLRSRSSSAKKSQLMQAARDVLEDAVPDFLENAIAQAVSGKEPPINDIPIKDHTPSDFARRNVWKTYLFPPQAPRFLAYRGPVTARPPISLVLVHPSFSAFALDLESQKLQLLEEDFRLAEGVYEMFTKGFENEVKQMNEGPLSDLFEQYLEALVFRSRKGTLMDGFMPFSETDGRPHPIFVVFEDKMDDGPNGYLEGLEISRRLFLSCARFSHGILVLRACPYIIIIAIVMDRKANVLLAEPLAHVPFWGPEYQTVLQGAKAMRAMKNFCNSYMPQQEIDVSRPWPIAAWQNVKPLSKDGLVLCGTSESKHMVAKFTQLYSREGHEAWHSQGLAPQLYNMKDLGAGWKFVTMQYLSESAGWHSVKDAPHDQLQQHLINQLLIEFLKKGHETGYVHGDFRPPNLLIHDNGTIQAIDFEWSGPDGDARYPVQLNQDIQWEPTARRGEVLQKIHDSWHVNKTGASTSQVA